MCESDDSMIKFSLIRRGGLELHSIFSLFMSADKIAGDYLDMDEDYFYEDFWAMLYDGELEIEIVENSELYSFTIRNWEEFYDYYSKEGV